MSTLKATNLANASSSSNNIVLDSSGHASITNDLKFNSGYGSVATAYGCRAWVNFNGTGTVAIRASGNVSSVTDNGQADYRVNFTSAMPDANYAVNTTFTHSSADVNTTNYFGNGRTPNLYQTTGSVRLNGFNGSNTGTYYDSPVVCVTIFR